MKQQLILLTIFLSTLSSSIYAQNVRFTSSGVIEFEKSLNTHAIFKKYINKDNEIYLRSAFENYQKNQAQFKILKSTLIFSGNHTLFTPIEDTGNSSDQFFGNDAITAQNNTIFSDLSTNLSTVQKRVFDDLYLVKDSIRKINWKITNETREIAGYECRRANAIIMDSVYVVAFYTDKIPVSGGPESFSGLPGMILGLAMPHDNVTWFAKTVKDRPVTDKELKVPVKGKPTDRKGLMATLNAAMKNWGAYAQMAFKAFML